MIDGRDNSRRISVSRVFLEMIFPCFALVENSRGAIIDYRAGVRIVHLSLPPEAGGKFAFLAV